MNNESEIRRAIKIHQKLKFETEIKIQQKEQELEELEILSTALGSSLMSLENKLINIVHGVNRE